GDRHQAPGLFDGPGPRDGGGVPGLRRWIASAGRAPARLPRSYGAWNSALRFTFCAPQTAIHSVAMNPETARRNHRRAAASLASAVGFALVLGSAGAVRQPGTETVEAHVAAARAAAGTEHTALLDLCAAPEPDPPRQDPAPAATPDLPDGSEWRMEPVKV